MTATDRLLPCPFCGGEASVVNHGDGSMSVGCANNRCLGFTGLGWLYKTKEQAIEAWNTRSITAAAVYGYQAAQGTCHIVKKKFPYSEVPMCSECGRYWLEDSDNFCSNCGRKVVA